MRLLAALLVPALAFAGDPFEVDVIPPDMIFTFSRRVRVRTVAADKTGEARPGAEAEIVVE